MNFSEPFSMMLVGVVIAAGVTLFLRQNAAHDARRRRRNYGRVVSKARRPMIMLNVRAARH